MLWQETWGWGAGTSAVSPCWSCNQGELSTHTHLPLTCHILPDAKISNKSRTGDRCSVVWKLPENTFGSSNPCLLQPMNSMLWLLLASYDISDNKVC